MGTSALVAVRIRRKFTGTAPFEACRSAEEWCESRGISVGRMEGPSPRGLLRGEFDIAKWRNLSERERAALHGTMTGDMRSGLVYVDVQCGEGLSS